MTARTQMLLMFAAAAALSACETEAPTEAEVDEMLRVADVEAEIDGMRVLHPTTPRDTLRGMAAEEDCPLRGVFLGVSQDGEYVVMRRRHTDDKHLDKLSAPMDWTGREEAQVTGRWESPTGAVGKFHMEMHDPKESAGAHGVVTGTWARAEQGETQSGSIGGVWRGAEDGRVEFVAYWTGC